MILGITMLGTCEAIGLADKLGLDPVKMFDIVAKSSGQSWSVTTYYPWPGPVPTAPSGAVPLISRSTETPDTETLTAKR